MDILQWIPTLIINAFNEWQEAFNLFLEIIRGVIIFMTMATLLTVFATLSLYFIVWILEISGVIENNFFHDFYEAALQWIDAIYIMDVPGIPIRLVESLLLYYFDEEKL